MAGRLADGPIYYGWVVVLACFLANGVVFGMSYAFGVFLEPLSTTFGGSTGETSLIFGVQLFVLYAAAPAVGGLVEWIGARRALVLGAACLAAGMLAGSRAGSLAALGATYGLLTGLGMSITFVVGYATPPQWFERRRGLATGLASSGLGIGLIVFAPLTAALVARGGWRWAFVVLGITLAGLLALAAYLMADDPAYVEAAVEREFPEGRPATVEGWREQLSGLREVAGSHTFLLLFAGYICLYGTLYVLLNHVVNFGAQLGAREAGVLAVSIVGVTTTVTRLAVGGVADRLGRLAMFVACGALMAVALLLLPLAGGGVALLAIAGLFGIGYGGTGALLSAVPADLFGGRNLNAIFGLVSLSLAAPGLLAPAIAGFGFDRLGTYGPVFLVTGIVGLAGVSLIAGAAHLRGEL